MPSTGTFSSATACTENRSGAADGADSAAEVPTCRKTGLLYVFELGEEAHRGLGLIICATYFPAFPFFGLEFHGGLKTAHIAS